MIDIDKYPFYYQKIEKIPKISNGTRFYSADTSNPNLFIARSQYHDTLIHQLPEGFISIYHTNFCERIFKASVLDSQRWYLITILRFGDGIEMRPSYRSIFIAVTNTKVITPYISDISKVIKVQNSTNHDEYTKFNKWNTDIERIFLNSVTYPVSSRTYFPQCVSWTYFNSSLFMFTTFDNIIHTFEASYDKASASYKITPGSMMKGYSFHSSLFSNTPHIYLIYSSTQKSRPPPKNLPQCSSPYGNTQKKINNTDCASPILIDKTKSDIPIKFKLPDEIKVTPNTEFHIFISPYRRKLASQINENRCVILANLDEISIVFPSSGYFIKIPYNYIIDEYIEIAKKSIKNIKININPETISKNNEFNYDCVGYSIGEAYFRPASRMPFYLFENDLLLVAAPRDFITAILIDQDDRIRASFMVPVIQPEQMINREMNHTNTNNSDTNSNNSNNNKTNNDNSNNKNNTNDNSKNSDNTYNNNNNSDNNDNNNSNNDNSKNNDNTNNNNSDNNDNNKNNNNSDNNNNNCDNNDNNNDNSKNNVDDNNSNNNNDNDNNKNNVDNRNMNDFVIVDKLDYLFSLNDKATRVLNETTGQIYNLKLNAKFFTSKDPLFIIPILHAIIHPTSCTDFFTNSYIVDNGIDDDIIPLITDEVLQTFWNCEVFNEILLLQFNTSNSSASFRERVCSTFARPHFYKKTVSLFIPYENEKDDSKKFAGYKSEMTPLFRSMTPDRDSFIKLRSNSMIYEIENNEIDNSKNRPPLSPIISQRSPLTEKLSRPFVNMGETDNENNTEDDINFIEEEDDDDDVVTDEDISVDEKKLIDNSTTPRLLQKNSAFYPSSLPRNRLSPAANVTTPNHNVAFKHHHDAVMESSKIPLSSFGSTPVSKNGDGSGNNSNNGKLNVFPIFNFRDIESRASKQTLESLQLNDMQSFFKNVLKIFNESIFFDLFKYSEKLRFPCYLQFIAIKMSLSEKPFHNSLIINEKIFNENLSVSANVKDFWSALRLLPHEIRWPEWTFTLDSKKQASPNENSKNQGLSNLDKNKNSFKVKRQWWYLRSKRCTMTVQEISQPVDNFFNFVEQFLVKSENKGFEFFQLHQNMFGSSLYQTAPKPSE